MANKLELTWIGKEKKIVVEPRILIADPENSHHAQGTLFDQAADDNMLIHGDNLLALKALEARFAGQVKCIYIDPPYNTGSAFEHYDDNLEHSIWLNMMNQRLQLLRGLLADDGGICIQIDAVEMSYLKVMLDEIFGRKNFINIISVKSKIAGVSGSNLGKSLQDNVEYILLYAKDILRFQLNSVPQKRQELLEYIEDYATQGKSWKYTTVMREIDEGVFLKSFPAGNGDVIKLYKHERYELCSVSQIASEEFGGDLKQAYYKYIDKILRTTNAQTSIRTKVIDETAEFDKGAGLFSIEYIPIKGKNAGKKIRSFYKDNNLIAWLRDVVSCEKRGIFKLDNIGNLWDDIQYNNLTKEGDVQFPNGKKPEALVARIIAMLSKENDIVLDSFLGSGTTAAVAHKMGRRWIGIEMGDHAYTHCKVRLDKVIAGEDDGGITKAVKWQGGGGYTFYELAPSLITRDSFDEPVINKAYNAEQLAAAVALHEGFRFQPDKECFWKQSVGNEKSYLFVTTAHITSQYLDSIHGSMAEGEFLIIAAKSFDRGLERAYREIAVKKIPQMLLDRCEFGVENYDLNIVNPPVYEDEEECDE